MRGHSVLSCLYAIALRIAPIFKRLSLCDSRSSTTGIPSRGMWYNFSLLLERSARCCAQTKRHFRMSEVRALSALSCRQGHTGLSMRLSLWRCCRSSRDRCLCWACVSDINVWRLCLEEKNPSSMQLCRCTGKRAASFIMATVSSAGSRRPSLLHAIIRLS